eukprot:scaffold1596_cov302-Pinguiococcus_pyrenoidosus.AAC.84
MASAAMLRLAACVRARNGRVLRDVEDEHVGRGRLGGDDHGVLRHVPRAVHLSVMRDLHVDLHLPMQAAEAAHLASLVVVLARVDLRLRQRQVHVRQHEEVGFATGVRAQDQLVLGHLPALHRARAGQPLHRERWPLQRMRHDQVVQERRVLLPDLVLLVDHELLLLLRAVVGARQLPRHGAERSGAKAEAVRRLPRKRATFRANAFKAANGGKSIHLPGCDRWIIRGRVEVPSHFIF